MCVTCIYIYCFNKQVKDKRVLGNLSCFYVTALLECIFICLQNSVSRGKELVGLFIAISVPTTASITWFSTYIYEVNKSNDLSKKEGKQASSRLLCVLFVSSLYLSFCFSPYHVKCELLPIIYMQRFRAQRVCLVWQELHSQEMEGGRGESESSSSQNWKLEKSTKITWTFTFDSAASYSKCTEPSKGKAQDPLHTIYYYNKRLEIAQVSNERGQLE